VIAQPDDPRLALSAEQLQELVTKAKLDSHLRRALCGDGRFAGAFSSYKKWAEAMKDPEASAAVLEQLRNSVDDDVVRVSLEWMESASMHEVYERRLRQGPGSWLGRNMRSRVTVKVGFNGVHGMTTRINGEGLTRPNTRPLPSFQDLTIGEGADTFESRRQQLWTEAKAASGVSSAPKQLAARIKDFRENSATTGVYQIVVQQDFWATRFVELDVGWPNSPVWESHLCLLTLSRRPGRRAALSCAAFCAACVRASRGPDPRAGAPPALGSNGSWVLVPRRRPRAARTLGRAPLRVRKLIASFLLPARCSTRSLLHAVHPANEMQTAAQ
jgi:hypothetical protein